MSGPDLSNYEEVPDRIVKFFEKHPEGSLRCERVEYKELPAAHLNGKPCLHIIYHAVAYRTPGDEKPGQGKASEPIPGLTPYTKGSELMNAETSAWGRALVALGFVGKKVASANEVRARQDSDAEGKTSRRQPSGDIKPSEAQVGLMWKLLNQQKASLPQLSAVLKGMGIDVPVKGMDNEEWPKRVLTGGREGTMSELITRLKDGNLPAVEQAETPASDVDNDTSAFDSDPGPGEKPPWEEAA